MGLSLKVQQSVYPVYGHYFQEGAAHAHTEGHWMHPQLQACLTCLHIYSLPDPSRKQSDTYTRHISYMIMPASFS